MTVVVPSLRRDENNLLLWNFYDLTSPMHTFSGHQDVILEFQLRSRDFKGIMFKVVEQLIASTGFDLLSCK